MPFNPFLLKIAIEVKVSKRVAGEVREIDVWFAPSDTTTAANLGLLGKLATTPCIFEPFRNPVTSNEILDCLLKLLEIRGEIQREANRNKTNIAEVNAPKLWILTPTASEQILSSFTATINENNWGKGIYFLAPALRAAIIVIHQLPKTPETLMLRILGRGRVQRTAIDELVALPLNDPLRENTLKLLYSLQKDLEVNQPENSDDRELIMRLSPLYQQDREQAIQQGARQERRQVLENLLLFRFGALDEEMRAIIAPFVALPAEEFTPLLLQLSTISRAELLGLICSLINQ